MTETLASKLRRERRVFLRLPYGVQGVHPGLLVWKHRIRLHLRTSLTDLRVQSDLTKGGSPRVQWYCESPSNWAPARRQFYRHFVNKILIGPGPD